ncbi:T-box transcription factor TBX6 [Taenia solium]|eukprot:TsM_000978900 transcript=TsM_000978900 gene=TsM_000978900
MLNILTSSRMAGASGEGGDYGGDEISAEARMLMEEGMHLALLTIAQSVPYFCPSGLNSELEFLSICIAGRDYELACLAQRPTITLRLLDQAAWSAARPGLMEMRVGGRIFPTLNVRIEGLLADGLYIIFLDLMPIVENVYRYQSSLWAPLHSTKPYPPPNRADTGPPVSNNQIFVHRGQVYLPRYHIVRHLTAEEAAVRQHSGVCGNAWLARLEYVGTYVIPGTEFVAVSGYHCRRIANLKLEARRGFAH